MGRAEWEAKGGRGGGGGGRGGERGGVGDGVGGDAAERLCSLCLFCLLVF